MGQGLGSSNGNSYLIYLFFLLLTKISVKNISYCY